MNVCALADLHSWMEEESIAAAAESAAFQFPQLIRPETPARGSAQRAGNFSKSVKNEQRCAGSV
jgi:hypothetical protein